MRDLTGNTLYFESHSFLLNCLGVINLSLNNYRDEAGDFLKKIGSDNLGIEEKVKWLEEEFNILKTSINEPSKLNHQVYDMLFLLFEIAFESNMDIETEWNNGRIRKQKKYIENL